MLRFFHGLLEAIFMLQPKAALLECVPGASSDPEVRGALQHLCHLMGWTMNDTELELMHQWPTRRRRWWVLLAPMAWDLSTFGPWPAQSRFDCISKALPSFGEFTLYEEENLMLTPKELKAYANPAYGREERLLQSNGICPTLLHSYGSALDGCPCGCRNGGFSSISLESKGLRGVFVISTLWNAPRYLHPLEAAILHTLPITVRFEGPPRHGLALVGQIAAPLQVIWAYIHLHNAAAKASSLQVLEPMDVLDKYRCTLLSQLHLKFPFALPQSPSSITVTGADGETLTLLTSKHQTVGDLIHAEQISLKPEDKIRGAIDGHVVPQCQILPDQSQVELQHFQRREQHVRTGQMAFAVCHGPDLLVAFATPGAFVFQLLDSLELTGVDYVVNTSGRIFGRDFRLWTTQRVTTLGLKTKPSMGFAPLVDGILTPPLGAQQLACGSSSSRPGLDDVSVWKACQQVIQHFTMLDPPLLIPPLLGLRLLDGEAALCFGAKHLPMDLIGSRIILPLILDEHWTLLWGTRHGDRVFWTCFDGLRSTLHPGALLAAKAISLQLRLEFCGIALETMVQQHHAHTCGVIALAHLCLALGFPGVFDDQSILRIHDWLRYHNSPSALLHGLGPEQTLMALTDLLGSKGVPSTAAKDRASAAIRILGKRDVEAALKSTNAWAELKKLASRPSSTFKFVHHHELMQVVEQRAKEKHSSALVGKKQKKTVKAVGSKPKEIQIDATMVRLPAGYFKDEDDDDIPQITFAEVTVDARGIAVCGPSDVLPFLEEPKSLSSDSLGLLVTTDLTVSWKTDQLTSITFPGVYAGTGESILVNGCLLNLGDVSINRHGPPDLAKNIEVTETRVVKLQVFRDEVTFPWDHFVAAPIKSVVSQVAALQRCLSDGGCGPSCHYFHPPVDTDIRQVIHEIWSRRFQTLAGKTIAEADAEVFQAFLRITEPALENVLLTVAAGIYFEPRSEERGPDPNYAVVWLPGTDRPTALHKMKLCSAAIALARLGSRFGVRVPQDSEQAAHELLRPDIKFVKCSAQRIFRLHPLPFGLQRPALETLLKEWKWTARPLQPGRGSQLGSSWDVGTTMDPPSNIMYAFGRDILINQVKERTHKDHTQMVTASKKTQQHMAHYAKTSASASSSSNADPWTNAQDDPWKQWNGLSGAPPGLSLPPSSQPAAKRITAVAETMKAEVHAALQKELSESSSGVDTQTFQQHQANNDQRLLALESGVQELRAQSSQFKTWFEQAGNQMKSQHDTIAAVQTELQQVKTDVTNSAAVVDRSLQSLQSNLSNDLDAKLSSQFERFESLLAKKHRTD